LQKDLNFIAEKSSPYIIPALRVRHTPVQSPIQSRDNRDNDKEKEETESEKEKAKENVVELDTQADQEGIQRDEMREEEERKQRALRGKQKEGEEADARSVIMGALGLLNSGNEAENKELPIGEEVKNFISLNGNLINI
jgi:hypothetical protein